MKEFFSKLDWIKITLVAIEAVGGTIGGALVIAEGHPIISIMFLAASAGANKVNAYLDKKQNSA